MNSVGEFSGADTFKRQKFSGNSVGQTLLEFRNSVVGKFSGTDTLKFSGKFSGTDTFKLLLNWLQRPVLEGLPSSKRKTTFG